MLLVGKQPALHQGGPVPLVPHQHKVSMVSAALTATCPMHLATTPLHRNDMEALLTSAEVSYEVSTNGFGGVCCSFQIGFLNDSEGVVGLDGL